MRESESLAQSLALLNESERNAILAELTDAQLLDLQYAWQFWARPDQLAPDGDWQVWLILAGRGFGKTRCIAEFARDQVESEQAKRIALVGRTAADVRDVIIEGESGIMAVCPPWFRPIYEPSKRRVVWPNGAIATAYSADEPSLLRGPQHDLAIVDELAAWRYRDAWDMLLLGLRLGSNPRCAVATTPRPKAVLRELVKDPTCVVTRGSTYDNAANLAPSFLSRIVSRYEGTSLGRQELYAELLDDMPGALWTRSLIDANRRGTDQAMRRIVVGVDPAISNTGDSDYTGIVVCGLGSDGHGYVLEDRSIRGSPKQWASRAVSAYHDWKADRIVAEKNQGGDMVESTLRNVDPNVAYIGVHASKGKLTRAEPISALYEQGRCHHAGLFPELEEQMCNYVPGLEASPDRMDAMVWAMTELMDLAPVLAAPVGMGSGSKYGNL